MKRTANIFETLTVQSQTDEIRTKVNPYQGEAAIYIEDQILAQRIRSEGDGVLNSDTFAKEMQSLLNIGLLEVLVKEKEAQLKESLNSIGILIYGEKKVRVELLIKSVLYLTPSYFFIHFANETNDAFTKFYPFIAGTMLAAFGGVHLLLVGYVTYLMKKRVEKYLFDEFNFMGKKHDMNPLTHALRLYAGRSYLDYEGNTLLSILEK